MSPFSLEGRTAIVTGAASGIGLATARRLADAGARVILSDIRAEVLADATARLVAEGLTAEPIPADVAIESDVAALIAATVERYGGLDIMVCNAGIQQPAPLFDLTLDECRTLIDVNLLGMFSCARLAARRMIDQGRGGRIISTASITGMRACTERFLIYGAAKAAMISLTQSLALTLAPHGITVNAVAPGNTLIERLEGVIPHPDDRPEIPIGRLARPSQIADTMLYLASDAASHVTGQTILIDGGQTLGYVSLRPSPIDDRPPTLTNPTPVVGRP